MIHPTQSIFKKSVAWLVCLQPMLMVTVKGWSNGILMLGGLISIVLLVWQKMTNNAPPLDIKNKKLTLLLVFSLISLTVATLFSALLRRDFYAAQFDSPARFLLAIPVFLLLRQTNFRLLRILMPTIAIGLILTLLHQLFIPQSNAWSADRMSTYFVDPLVFGYTSLCFALLCLFSIHLEEKDSLGMIVLKLFAGMVGIYLSVMSQSRTGWLAIPFVIAFSLYFYRNKLSGKIISVALVATFIAATLLYQFSSTIKIRTEQALSEVSSYSFNGMAPDTSVGMRITFLRIAADMLKENPISGYGDTQRKPPTAPPKTHQYASQYTIDFSLSSGFHNEIITTSIHSGGGGALSILFIFFAPLFIYIKGLRSGNEQHRAAAALGVIFTIVMVISSFSTEIFGLKYTASYFALMTAVFSSIVLSREDFDKSPGLAPDKQPLPANVHKNEDHAAFIYRSNKAL